MYGQLTILKSIEGEGSIMGLRLSYAFYVLYSFALTAVLFIAAEYLFSLNAKFGVVMLVIPFSLYILLRIKTKSSKKRYEFESYVAARLQHKTIRSSNKHSLC